MIRCRDLTMEKVLYCNVCGEFFDVNYVNGNRCCPIANCYGLELSEINGKMRGLIRTLNGEKYYVLDASVDSTRIYMVIDGIHHFENVPKGFCIEHVYDSYVMVEWDGTCECEPFTRLDYIETNYSKTDDELDEVINDIRAWVDALCFRRRNRITQYLLNWLALRVSLFCCCLSFWLMFIILLLIFNDNKIQ